MSAFDELRSAPRVYSYLRFSTPEQAAGDSERRQIKRAEEFAAKYGKTLEIGFSDKGVSAYRGDNSRTGALAKFLAAVHAGEVPKGSVLIVEGMDRVSRQNPWEALPDFQSLVNAGIVIVTMRDEKVYSRQEMRGNPMAIMQSIFGMMEAHAESVRKSDHMKRVWAEKRRTAVANKKPLSKRGPEWLQLADDRSCWHVIEERAAIVRRIYRLAIESIGQQSIADLLNEEKVKTFRKAAFWHKSYVKKILENRAVIGEYQPSETYYDGGGRKKRRAVGEPASDYYPKVVPIEDFHAVRAMMRGKQGVRSGSSIANILATLARCPHCGGTMTRKALGKSETPVLVCVRARAGHCTGPYRQLSMAGIEPALRAAFRFPLPELTPEFAFHEGFVSAMEVGLETQKRRQARLLDLLEEHGASVAISERLRKIEESVSTLQASIAKAREDEEVLSGRATQERVNTLRGQLMRIGPIDRQKVNALLRQLFSKVVVDWPRSKLLLHWMHADHVTSIDFELFSRGRPRGDRHKRPAAMGAQ